MDDSPDNAETTPAGPGAVPPRPQLRISAEDLQSPEVNERVEQLKEASAPQLIRQVGTPQQQPTNRGIFSTNVLIMAGVGLVGGLAGWVISEILMRPDSPNAPFSDSPTVSTAVWLTLFCCGLASVLAAWEGVEIRSPEKALRNLGRTLPIAAGLALVGGFIAQAIFGVFVEEAVERALDTATSVDDFFRRMENALRIPRAIGFLIAGTAVGAGLGLGSRAFQRMINGAIGGAAGGFIGGLVFSVFSSGGIARATAFALTGTAVAAGIALVEEARKDLWLEIVTGGMAGKQFIIYHDRTMVGSSPHCGVTLIKDAGIAPEHAELVRSSDGTTIRALGQQPVVVNGRPLQQHGLNDGDQVQLGSTVVRFASREQAMPTLHEQF